MQSVIYNLGTKTGTQRTDGVAKIMINTLFKQTCQKLRNQMLVTLIITIYNASHHLLTRILHGDDKNQGVTISADFQLPRFYRDRGIGLPAAAVLRERKSWEKIKEASSSVR